MRAISLGIAVASLCLVQAGLAPAQELVSGFEARSLQGTKGVTLQYRLFKVSNPTPGMKYPLILFLHGAGERGDDNTAQLTANQGATVWASDAHQAEHPAYVIAPQCPADQQWVDTDWTLGSYSTTNIPVSDELATALEIADEVAMEFETDPARHYITGLSMGGYGTWDAIIRNPARFAAALPVCGAGDPSKVDLIKDLRLWVAHGDADSVVPVSGSRDMVAALEAAGSAVEYSEYAGVDHDSWSQTYANEDIVNWLFTNQRPLPPVGGSGGMAGASGSGGLSGGGGAAGSVAVSGGASGSPATAGASTGGSGAGTEPSSGAGGSGLTTAGSRDDGGCSLPPRPGAGPGKVGNYLVLAAFFMLGAGRRRKVRPAA
ncbi:MAG TPA: prolyl oligopeptidase family serine peptidase [Polyangiaceae bacterium]|nr:prolyl oligopeptidase family serine peptidase [Polyangiaceae bacterium]